MCFSVSESESSSDDDVEIISESGSVIVIDSEDDSNVEHSPAPKKSKVEKVESSPSPARSSGFASPTFPSDVSDNSDVENDSPAVVPVANGSNCLTKKQEDSELLDHVSLIDYYTRVLLLGPHPDRITKLFGINRKCSQTPSEN